MDAEPWGIDCIAWKLPKALSSPLTEQTTDEEEFQAKCDRFKTVKDSVAVWMLRHVTYDDESVRIRSKLTYSSKFSSSRLSMEKLKEQQRNAERNSRASALSQRRE